MQVSISQRLEHCYKAVQGASSRHHPHRFSSLDYIKIENLWMFRKNRATRSQHQGLGEVGSEPRPHLRTRPKASFIAPAGCFYKTDSLQNLSFNFWILEILLCFALLGHVCLIIINNNNKMIDSLGFRFLLENGNGHGLIYWLNPCLPSIN